MMWATVGSSNYDGFSLFVNQEANVVVMDVDFAKKLRAHIERGVAERAGRFIRVRQDSPLQADFLSLRLPDL